MTGPPTPAHYQRVCLKNSQGKAHITQASNRVLKKTFSSVQKDTCWCRPAQEVKNQFLANKLSLAWFIFLSLYFVFFSILLFSGSVFQFLSYRISVWFLFKSFNTFSSTLKTSVCRAQNMLQRVSSMVTVYFCSKSACQQLALS